MYFFSITAHFLHFYIVKLCFWENHANKWLQRENLISPGDFYIDCSVKNEHFMYFRKNGGWNFSQHTVLCQHTCSIDSVLLQRNILALRPTDCFCLTLDTKTWIKSHSLSNFVRYLIIHDLHIVSIYIPTMLKVY